MTPESIHEPAPDFVREVLLVLLLSTMAPEMVLPEVVPVRVSVFAPAPVAVKLEVKVSAPVPELSRVAPPVVPARLMMRLVEVVPPV